MAKVLVSLVSDQTIPNSRLIKEFKDQVDVFVFISSAKMEENKKVQSIQQVFDIPDKKVTIIIVEEFNFNSIEDKLLAFDFNDDDAYLVNITGGTKPMSIVALSFFTVFNNAKCFYLPIGENTYRQVHPRISWPEKEFKTHLTIKEYLRSYNLELLSYIDTPTKENRKSFNLMNKVLEHNGDGFKVRKIKEAHELELQEDKVFYSGGWFEEYIFTKIKTHFSLNKNQIILNGKIRSNNSENEYDIVFVYKDSIYVVETKAYFSLSKVKEKVQKDLYKLGALSSDFGLRVNALYITTANIAGEIGFSNKELQNRSKSRGIQVFQLNDLKEDKFLALIK